MAAKGARVHIYGDWDGSGVKKAQQDLSYFDRQAKAFSGSFSKSIMGAGAAIGGAFAVGSIISATTDFLRDSMQAAMEDEKSMTALAQAMRNVGLASENAKAEGLLKSLSLQVGVADDELRPAYLRLVTATKDVGQAQSLLKTALDISAAGYADTESAAKALSAAALGNFTALQRLKLPIDANTIASKDFAGAMTQLNGIVGGQAAAAAETYQGKLNRLSVAAGEAKETIGYALLAAVDAASKSFGGTGGLTAAIDAAGQNIGYFIKGIGAAVNDMNRMVASAKQLIPSLGGVEGSIIDLTVQFYRLLPGSRQLLQIWDLLTSRGKTFVTPERDMRGYTDAIAAYDPKARLARIRSDAMAAGFDNAADAADGAAGSVLRLSSALDVYTKVGYTPGGVVLPGQDFEQQQLNDRMKASLAAARQAMALASSRSGGRSGSGGSSGSADAETPAEKKAKEAAKKAADALKERMQQLKSYAEETGRAITGFLSIDAAFTAFSDRQKAASDAYAALIEAQKQLGENATQAEKDRVAELQKVYDNAKQAAAQGAQDIVGEFVARAEQAKQFGEKLKVLLANNLNKQTFDEIAGMSAERGIQVANAFIDGNIRQNIDRVNNAVDSAKLVADQVGVQAATTFKDVGEGLAKGMMAALAAILKPDSKQSKTLRSMMDDFAKSLNRVATVDVVTRRYELGQTPPDVPSSGIDWAAQVAAVSGVTNDAISDADFNAVFDRINAWADGSWTPMATGGIVTGPTPIIAGEAGPEAIIPLSRAGSMLPAGNTYNITVQAGIGDPRAIGQQVVEAIKKWENVNGPYFARAS